MGEIIENRKFEQKKIINKITKKKEKKRIKENKIGADMTGKNKWVTKSRSNFGSIVQNGIDFFFFSLAQIEIRESNEIKTNKQRDYSFEFHESIWNEINSALDLIDLNGLDWRRGGRF